MDMSFFVPRANSIPRKLHYASKYHCTCGYVGPHFYGFTDAESDRDQVVHSEILRTCRDVEMEMDKISWPMVLRSDARTITPRREKVSQIPRIVAKQRYSL